MLLDEDKVRQFKGGTFYVTTLLIRRVRELVNGSPKRVKTDLSDPVQIAFEELNRGKLLPSEGAEENVEE